MHVSPTARRTVLVALLVAVASARADVVRLKNGGKIEGEVVSETPTTVVVNSGSGKVSVDRALIESIERTPTPAPTIVTTRTGPHFRVSCHFEAGVFADEALAAAEAAWPATIEALGAAPAALERPLDVHVYRDPAEFAAVKLKLMGGVDRRDHSGFADYASQTAHVKISHAYDDAVWKRFGSPTHVLDSVAHEAAHLTALTCAANGRFHPRWFSEGLAEHAAKVVHRGRAGRGGPASDAHMSAQMSECRLLRRQGLLPEPRAIVQGRIDHLDEYDRYAVEWAFFELLLTPEQRGRTGKLLAEMSSMAAGDDFGGRLTGVVEKLWGDKGLDDLNDALRRLVDSFEPPWDTDGTIDVRGEQWIQWAEADGARSWRTARIGRKDYRLTGAFEIVSGDARRVEVDLGRDDAGFVAVAFDANGGVSVSQYSEADGEWRVLASGGDAGTIGAAKTEFEIRVGVDSIRVSVGGKEVVAAPLGDRDLFGAWGVGVHAGAAAVWTGVTLQ